MLIAGLAVAEVKTLVVTLLVMAIDVAIAVVLAPVVTVMKPLVKSAELVFSGVSSLSFVLSGFSSSSLVFVGAGLAECEMGVSVVIGCGGADALIVLMVKVTAGVGRDWVSVGGSIPNVSVPASVGVDPATETVFVDFVDLAVVFDVLVVLAVLADSDLLSGSSMNWNTGSDLADRLLSWSPASRVTPSPR